MSVLPLIIHNIKTIVYKSSARLTAVLILESIHWTIEYHITNIPRCINNNNSLTSTQGWEENGGKVKILMRGICFTELKKFG